MAARSFAREAVRRLGRNTDEIIAPLSLGYIPGRLARGRLVEDTTRESSSRYLATRTFGEAPSHGTPAGLAVATAAERIITPSTCEHLRTRGYAIVDGAMEGIDVDGVPLAEAMLNELRTLSSSPGVMARNATVLVGKDGVANRLEKSNIFEAEVHALSEESLADAPTLRAAWEDRTQLTLLNVMLPARAPPQSLHYQSVKLQRNAGRGGCFPLHFDSDAGLDARVVTALTYLNPTWKPGDGGELALFPFPDDPIMVEPIAGRVVLFSSANTLHRVLPSSVERFCFTTWFFAKQARSDDGDEGRTTTHTGAASTQLARKAADAYWGSGKSNDDPWPEPGAEEIRTMRECEALLAPGMRKHLTRLVHAEEWAASIAESHPDTPERTRALETHRREVDVIARAIGGRYPRGLARIGSAMGSERGGAVRERLGGLEVRWF